MPCGHELSLYGTARGGRVARSLSAIRQAATNLPRNDWMTTARILALVLVAPQACHSGEHASSASGLRTRVVDSVRGRAWWRNDDSMFTYLVEIRATNSADTVRGVVPPLPTILGDTQVMGLRVDTAKYDRVIFTYDARSHRVEDQSLPLDAWPGLFDFSISPGGEYLLYVTWVSGPIGEVAVIRNRRSGERVLTGPRWALCECDSDDHHAHWVTADSFEIARGVSSRSPWERFSGSVSRRSVHTDTLPAEPHWH